jgi:hypothetical protein
MRRPTEIARESHMFLDYWRPMLLPDSLSISLGTAVTSIVLLFLCRHMGGGALYRWYLLSLLYVLAVLINWLACMMLFIARWEGAEYSWLSDVKGRDLRHAPRFQKYMAACYWQLISTLTVGYGKDAGGQGWIGQQGSVSLVVWWC